MGFINQKGCVTIEVLDTNDTKENWKPLCLYHKSYQRSYSLDWGYKGSAPFQLAHALLCSYLELPKDCPPSELMKIGFDHYANCWFNALCEYVISLPKNAPWVLYDSGKPNSILHILKASNERGIKSLYFDSGWHLNKS